MQNFMDDLKTGKSTPLLNVTSGYHFHKISAESEEVLDEIEEALKRKAILRNYFHMNSKKLKNRDIDLKSNSLYNKITYAYEKEMKP